MMEREKYIAENAGRVLHRATRTWYGLPVDITVASNNFHRVAMPGLALPHPGVVNIFSRWEMPMQERLELTYRHELGHLQMLPVPLVHLLLLLWPRPGQRHGTRWLRWLIGLIAHQALWELAAEGYVVATVSREHWSSRSTPARWLYVGFWAGIAFLAITGTAFSMKRKAA